MTVQTPRLRGEYAKTSARRQEILNAAVEVFSAAGFHNGSLRDVAERVGLSQAGVLHHFPSKTHLVGAVLEWRDEDVRTRFEAGETGLATLRRMVALVEYNQQNVQLVELHTTLSAEATSTNHPAHEYFVNRYEWVVRFLQAAFEEASATGHLRAEVEPTSAAKCLAALMDGLQIQWLYNRDSVDMAAEVRRYIQSQLTVAL